MQWSEPGSYESDFRQSWRGKASMDLQTFFAQAKEQLATVTDVKQIEKTMSNLADARHSHKDSDTKAYQPRRRKTTPELARNALI
eukprot:5071198-Amphidinium_carterae.1